MAGLACSQCGAGIRYHGEPCGIEYTIFHNDVWNTITSTVYDKENERIHEEWLVPGPYLYQSDTIWDDFKNEYQDAWVCPKCGAVMVFKIGGIVVDRAYAPVYENQEIKPTGISYVVFSDYLWDEITELSIPVSEIPNRFKPSYLAVANEEYMWLQDYDSPERTIKFYQRIEISKEE